MISELLKRVKTIHKARHATRNPVDPDIPRTPFVRSYKWFNVISIKPDLSIGYSVVNHTDHYPDTAFESDNAKRIGPNVVHIKHPDGTITIVVGHNTLPIG